jgi:hypothetical protein
LTAAGIANTQADSGNFELLKKQQFSLPSRLDRTRWGKLHPALSEETLRFPRYFVPPVIVRHDRADEQRKRERREEKGSEEKGRGIHPGNENLSA